MSTQRSRPADSEDAPRRPVPVRGPVLSAGLVACAGATLAAATLGWLGVAILVAFLAMIVALMGGLMVLKRVDHAWILVRRAAGIDQRNGAMGRVFAVTAAICAAAFAFWFIVINGPGSSSFSGQGG